MIRSFMYFRKHFSLYPSMYVCRLVSEHLGCALRCDKFSKTFCTSTNSGLTINDPRVQKYLKKLRTEYDDCKTRESSNRDVNKRMNNLAKVFMIVQHIYNLQSSIKVLDDLIQAGSEDKELASLAEEERAGYVERIRDLEAQLLHALVPEAPGGDCSEVVVEVSAGVGGQEAMLFAHELFHMYRCYAIYKGWQVQVAELEQSDLGGLRHASLLVCGDQAYQHLRHEAGVHRVQRVPATEKSGRVHTSTVTVATLPQPAEVDVRLRDKDLQVETKRASGAGGQHVNTTDSAVRVTHLPTGLVVDCQVDRSQIKNREMALRTLRARLYQRETDRQLAETVAARKLQVGSSLRSEKIRTYNFNQDRVTDHRLGSTLHNLRGFLSGAEALDCLIRDLDDAEKANRLQQILEQ